MAAAYEISDHTFAFLRELSLQPRRGPATKAWFAANRSRYEQHVRRPFKQLEGEAERWLSAVDPAQSVTTSRIRSLAGFKDNLWAQFGGGHGGPQLFLRVTPAFVDFGFSTYAATPWQRRLLHEAIVETPKTFWRYLGPLRDQLVFEPNADDISRHVTVASSDDLKRWAEGWAHGWSPRIARYVYPGDPLLRRDRLGTEVARTLLALHRLAAAIWEAEERKPEAHGVFISYRRADSNGCSARLHDALADRLRDHEGPPEIFFDRASIAGGDDWWARIVKALGHSRVVLAVIGHGWSGESARGRRIDAPDDIVRRELEQALRMGRTVLPVLVGGARMPDARELPDGLRPLADIQAFPLRDERWAGDINTLLDAVAERLAD